MLHISKITHDLQPYQGKSTILWGNGSTCGLFLTLFKENGIQVSAICDPDWNSPSLREQIPVIHPSSLGELGEIHTFVIQMALDTLEEEKITVALLSKVGYFALISAQEAWSILHFMEELDKNLSHPETIQHQQIQKQQDINEELKLLQFSTTQLEQELLVLCMPPKTGDYTIINTLTQHQIPHHFVFHKPDTIPLNLLHDIHPKIKIITAVRDPIAENLSLCFQILSDLKESLTARYLLSGKYSRAYFKDGGNLQDFFNLFLEGIPGSCLCGSHPIQRFIPVFQNHIFDYLSFPFDQKKGYAICKKNNISVFVYQLEKLDHLLPELSHFVGKPIPSFTMGNQASDKWIGNAYQLAKKELKITEQYWKESYDSLWVKHFYSPADIQSFQNKWKNNIQ